MKKLLSFILTIVLLISVVPLDAFTFTASAETATSGTTGDCTWTLDGTVLTISGEGAMGDHWSTSPWGTEITELVVENGVTSIGHASFYNCENLTSVTIPPSVTTIGELAFEQCENIKSIYITDIAAWCNIKHLENQGNICLLRYGGDLYLNGKLVTNVTIPDGVTTLPKYAFSCKSLKSITIPDSVTSIGSSAFYGCSNLSEIKISNSITSIEDWTFYDCNSLNRITIPASVAEIGAFAFENCTNLENVIIQDGVTSIRIGAFRNCSSLASVELPDSIKTIEPYAFQDCSALKEINIPVGVSGPDKEEIEGIADGTFINCSSLISITIPEGVISIGDSAFSGCSSLNNVEISNSVTNIGAHSFRDCISLESIIIPDSVTDIGVMAFRNCDSLKNVWYTGSKNDKQDINIGSYNENLIGATWHYNTCANDAHTYSGTCDADCNNCEWTRTVSAHTYTNACDKDCNECGQTKLVYTHDYNDCYVGYEEEFFGSWQISPSQTGVYSIKPTSWQGDFSDHYIAIFDQNGDAIKYNESKQGWPLVKEEKYTISVRCYDLENSFNTNWTLEKITDTIFSDTDKNGWYNNAITYAVGAGILKGYDNGKFGTSDSIQRQDFLVMLARLDGVDLATYKYKSKFPDVERNSYYEAAVNWGVKNGIVTGYTDTGRFGVGDKVTREQLVTLLYRYAKYKGYDSNCSSNRESIVKRDFKDYSSVSDFSKEAILWAIEKGVISGKTINGKTGYIAPQGNAQRCEVAQIMYNIFLNNIF